MASVSCTGWELWVRGLGQSILRQPLTLFSMVPSKPPSYYLAILSRPVVGSISLPGWLGGLRVCFSSALWLVGEKVIIEQPLPGLRVGPTLRHFSHDLDRVLLRIVTMPHSTR